MLCSVQLSSSTTSSLGSATELSDFFALFVSLLRSSYATPCWPYRDTLASTLISNTTYVLSLHCHTGLQCVSYTFQSHCFLNLYVCPTLSLSFSQTSHQARSPNSPTQKAMHKQYDLQGQLLFNLLMYWLCRGRSGLGFTTRYPLSIYEEQVHKDPKGLHALAPWIRPS